MEIANPIMAAEVRALRLTSVGIAASAECFSTESLNGASEVSGAPVGTCFSFCVSVRFNNDLLVCEECLTIPD